MRENGGDPLVGFTWDNAGRRSGLTSGGTATSYGYDPVGRLQSLAHNLAGTSSDQTIDFTYNRQARFEAGAEATTATPGRALMRSTGLTP